MPHMNKDDIVLYHMSTGSELNEMFGDMKCKKVMIYHNITPPEMLEPYNKARISANLMCPVNITYLMQLSWAYFCIFSLYVSYPPSFPTRISRELEL